ncbi:MAG TPA: membrane protein insertion efficiency factor YidD [Fibrobacteres bacterium]|jgi:putative membrane protein insertion efficiency factor|nr:membrane protein insertion efficiency factor YidD [Fibrobacterota bacterium]
MKTLILFLIRFYQAVHLPFFRGTCRFYPTCSSYAAEAVETHGALHGAWLAVRRLLRCQPFCRGGFDPVPPVEKAPKLSLKMSLRRFA